MIQTVFLKDKPIYLCDELTDNLLLNAQLVVKFDGESDISLSLSLFEESKEIKSLLLYCENINLLLDCFYSIFKTIEAAGGVVTNQQNQTLLIYRYERWDLPKGKIEKGESPELAAVREVQEECGVKNISITKPLSKTYHCFEHYGQRALKITHWYKMICTDENLTLIPQTEEGITDVKWLDKDALQKAMTSAYGSIRLVVEEAIQ